MGLSHHSQLMAFSANSQWDDDDGNWNALLVLFHANFQGELRSGSRLEFCRRDSVLRANKEYAQKCCGSTKLVSNPIFATITRSFWVKYYADNEESSL